MWGPQHRSALGYGRGDDLLDVGADLFGFVEMLMAGEEALDLDDERASCPSGSDVDMLDTGDGERGSFG